MRRKYKTGTKWCFWRWSEADSEYITRLHVVKTPWFAICLHWLNKPDPEPFLHDHPVSFLSIILRGGYTEVKHRAFDNGRQWWERNWYNIIRAHPNDRHTIMSVKPGTLTLCFMGPKTREWGFHTDTDGWVYWRDYYRVKRAENGQV